jgi:hypothetical protein
MWHKVATIWQIRPLAFLPLNQIAKMARGMEPHRPRGRPCPDDSEHGFNAFDLFLMKGLRMVSEENGGLMVMPTNELLV